jgi:hypothetical protein
VNEHGVKKQCMRSLTTEASGILHQDLRPLLRVPSCP